ncbi:MAG TPA: hypothetical protein VFB67_07755 [Candidatus Polarisedimenticolaceae bacterium]|nr:hypothetical protein [Candidatus Polarisedimenticolaceae bacterium]
MRRLFVLSLALILAALLAPARAGELDGRFRGTALIRTDAAQRIVVVLDANDDGLADHAFLFEPRRALKHPVAPLTKEVVVRAEGDELEVHALDRSLGLRLSTSLPHQGESATSVSGTTTTAYGRALAHYDLTSPLLNRHVALAEVDTDGLDAMAPADGPPCGGSDVECWNGGKGSLSCSGGCETGGGAQAGISLTVAGGVNYGSTKPTKAPCSVSCGDGYFSCCRCENSAANTQPTPKCTCREISSLQPCR